NHITTVPQEQINTLPIGAPVTTESRIILQGELGILPDLVPFAAEDLHLARSGGRVQLKFTTAFWNRGGGPLELNTIAGSRTEDGDFPAMQRLVRPNGQVRNIPVGTLFWHAPHNHYHYDDFATYALEKITEDGRVDGDAV